jgi:hypothetical protein
MRIGADAGRRFMDVGGCIPDKEETSVTLFGVDKLRRWVL